MSDPQRPRVLVTRSLGAVLAPLYEVAEVDLWTGPGAPSPQDLSERAQHCHGLLCMLTDRVDRDLLAACPRLRVVSSFSVGLDHVDLVAAGELGIEVGHTPGVLAETTADLAFGLLLAAARRIPEAERFIRDGEWTWERRWEPDMFLGSDVHGATLGLLGLGAIGRAVARRAQGFGMRVLGWTRSDRQVPGVERVPVARLLAESDYVSVHVARTPETEGMLDARALAQMKPGAVLVNTARGGIVDEAALAEALHCGQLGGAALDVFEREPLPPTSPLRAAPNLLLVPHIGSASASTRRTMGELAVANLLAGLHGERLPHGASDTAGRGAAGGTPRRGPGGGPGR